jgi:hypothetical protein
MHGKYKNLGSNECMSYAEASIAGLHNRASLLPRIFFIKCAVLSARIGASLPKYLPGEVAI